MIFPKGKGNEHKESEPGFRLSLESGNTYEIKVWIPRTPFSVSSWVTVKKKCEKK
jgi:hypothetical protein